MKPNTPTKIGITTHSMMSSWRVWMSAASFDPAGRKFHSSASAEADTASPATAAKNAMMVLDPRARCPVTHCPFMFFFPESDPQSSGELGGELDAGERCEMPSDPQRLCGPAQPPARAVAFILLETPPRPPRVELVARGAR